MTTLQIDGRTIGYELVGDSGPSVLLLHGTTMNHTSFDGLRAAMPTDVPYQYVMMDLPGSGESTVSDEPLTIEGVAADAHALMDSLGYERYHAVGFSIGAMVTAALAALQPNAVRSATLIAGWISADARMKATFELWRRLIAADPELFTRYALVDGFTVDAQEMMAPMLDAIISMSATTVAPGSAAHIDLDIAVDVAPLIEQIVAPTLIIGGTEDRWVDVTHSHALGRAITGSRVEVLAVGHMMLAEQPAQVAALLHPHFVAN